LWEKKTEKGGRIMKQDIVAIGEAVKAIERGMVEWKKKNVSPEVREIIKLDVEVSLMVLEKQDFFKGRQEKLAMINRFFGLDKK
jgi:hypothetical protein